MTFKAYAHLDVSNGSYCHRLLWPFRYCDGDLGNWDAELSLGSPTRPFDAYFLHSITKWSNYPHIAQWQHDGGFWVWSVDDDMPSVPQWNPCRPTGEEQEMESWWLSERLADVILCSTPALAATFRNPEKTIVARNLLEVDAYKVTEPAPERKVLRVLWAGSRTHDGDVAILTEPIDALLDKWEGKVDFIFVGSGPGKLFQKRLDRGVHFEKGVPLGLYPKLLNNIRPDIVLAPLADIPFNHSKSSIRILESWALAAAVIASPVGEYNCIRDGVDGLYANSAADWYDRLDRLLTDTYLRRSLAVNGRARVAAEGDWANPACRTEWVAAFREIERRWLARGRSEGTQ